MGYDRRRQGRPRNPNRPPADAHLATRKEVLDELDHLVSYSRMPLGQKLESLIAEVKMYRKNLVGQQRTSQPASTSRQELLINQWSEDEIKVMKESGWNIQ